MDQRRSSPVYVEKLALLICVGLVGFFPLQSSRLSDEGLLSLQKVPADTEHLSDQLGPESQVLPAQAGRGPAQRYSGDFSFRGS